MTATRFKLLIEYDGSALVGWQRQDNGPSVQQAIEEAIEKTTGERVTVHGAGRTDAGVHALGQVAHADIAYPIQPDRLREALNYHLQPSPVAILAAEVAPAEFHARFSATGRAYRYRIINRRAPLTVDRGHAWHVKVPLDAGAMHEAAQYLIGQHDFSTFRAAFCQAKSPVKTLDRLDVRRFGDEIEVIAAARSFLHHQVRNMVGSLSLVGIGKWSADRLAAALAARDRAKGGPTAPADGLYLTHVSYDN
ncbi:tRNA pseudouridine(38-40) synthase TruA [Dongia soli]|uniref:tRNA pseudouridine synthase A n=1 Tax=Dongia soli TaxID=600628 RepID=A0ABU5E6L4_9PROT|nr:tRNA pseudouridine(38-40) synthase TruA [Dongia soli]MDY0881674.1 tRNA pseudouridine(38-40) synthase TruA [Dongia soli]